MVNYTIAALFLLFAGWQYNDPDPHIWFPLYSIVAICFIIKNIRKQVLYLILIPYIIFACTYIPDFIDWIKNDMPTITGSMKASNPEVEFMREFFGLILCTIALIYRSKKIS
jgi:hypothetical protein